MKRYVLTSILFAGITGAALSQDAPGGDAERLHGEWMLTSAEIQGKTLPAPVGKGGSIVFAKDGKLMMKDPGKPDRAGTYTIDAGKSPKQLNLILAKDGKEGEAMQGIYDLTDEELRIAFAKDGRRGKRPEEFKGDKIVILHLKRQKL